MDAMDKAVLTADWICRNQYKHLPEWVPAVHKDFDMNEDMNFGRFVRNYSLSERKIVHLSTNWISGMTLYALLALYDYGREPTCLAAAQTGVHYLKCLQNTMETNPRAQGAINERISANRWCAPRDALSAAWGMLRLHRCTGDEEMLRRAELFAEWHRTAAMEDGYPPAYIFFSDSPDETRWGSCQGGSALFYYDLFKLTGDTRYRDTMLTIADAFMEHFVNEDGSIVIIYDRKTGYRGDAKDSPEWSDMHKYNDDFGAIGLLAAYEVTGDRRYYETVVRYMDWVCSRQNSDGGFGLYSLSVSSCVVALNCLNLHLINGNPRLLATGRRALEHLETQRVHAPDDPATHGAFLGMEVAQLAKNNDMISLRVTMYAVVTYLLYGVYERHLAVGDFARVPEALVENPLLIGLTLKPGRI